MGHENKKTLSRQMYEVMQSKQGFGRSKQEDKVLGITDLYIYSYNTMRTYIKHCNYFLDWCKNNETIRNDLGHKPHNLAECKAYVQQFIRYQENRGLSAYTVKMEKSALGKLYGEAFEFETIATNRANITRSRGMTVRDGHFSVEKNADLINACRHVGFRRMELEKCKAEDLFCRDGQWYVRIHGKGGRFREAPVIDNDERTLNYIRTMTGKNHVHTAADIHSYRADYATAIYKANMRDLEALKGKKLNYTELTGKRDKNGKDIYKPALYYCRNDKKGIVYDRKAMILASQALGHNRESVVGEHYIHLTK